MQVGRYFTILGRALRLRCPVCGAGSLFSGWFTMHKTCAGCGIRFEREPGFFLGSIYFNYGLTALVVAIVYPVLLFNQIVGETPLLLGALAFSIFFPMLFFRHARSLWLGFDHFVDPREIDGAKEEAGTNVP